jgi:protein TonB
MVWILGIVCALVLHVGFILFGGLIVPHAEAQHARTQVVELLSEEAAKEDKNKDKEEVRTTEEKDRLETKEEQPPDAADLLRNLDLQAAPDAPALEAVSLNALEQALSGQAGAGGDFGSSLTLASGGRIGGTGKAHALSEEAENAFNLAEIDQKPRAILQTMPLYPAEMRGKKVESAVTVIFVVDAAGRVNSPKVEKSSHPAFDRPALEAVRQWKFEPAVRAGQRVACKMRAPIRFRQG